MKDDNKRQDTNNETSDHDSVKDSPVLAGPPNRLSNGHAVALTILTSLAVLWALYVARAIAFPIVLALLIAFPLRPLVRWLTRLHIPSFIAACMVVGALIVVCLSAGVLLIEPANEWISDAPDSLSQARGKLEGVFESVKGINEASETVENLTQGDEPPQALQVEIKQPSLTSIVLSKTGNLLVTAIIAGSLIFLLLAFGDGLLRTIVRMVPEYRDRNNVYQMCQCVEWTISQYLLTFTLINVGLGTVIGVGLWLMGMPNPVMWGVMAGCLNFIPFLGLIGGTAIVFIAALISFDSVGYAMLAPAIYLTANGVEANLITPMLLGRSMRLNIVVIFLSLVLWGWMWGVGGALIAVPILAAAKIVCDHFERLKPFGMLLGAPD